MLGDSVCLKWVVFDEEVGIRMDILSTRFESATEPTATGYYSNLRSELKCRWHLFWGWPTKSVA